MAHTAPAAPSILHRTRIGKGAKNKFGIDSQWRNEFFYCHLLFINRKSQNECSVPLEVLQRLSYRHWLGCNSVCSSFSNCKWKMTIKKIDFNNFKHLAGLAHRLSFLCVASAGYRPLTKAQWSFTSAIPIGFQISKIKQKKQGSALKTLQGSHRKGDGPIFIKKTFLPNSLMTTYRMNLRNCILWECREVKQLLFFEDSVNLTSLTLFVC